MLSKYSKVRQSGLVWEFRREDKRREKERKEKKVSEVIYFNII